MEQLPPMLTFLDGLFLAGKAFGIGVVMWAGWRAYVLASDWDAK